MTEAYKQYKGDAINVLVDANAAAETKRVLDFFAIDKASLPQLRAFAQVRQSLHPAPAPASATLLLVLLLFLLLYCFLTRVVLLHHIL